VAERWGDPHQDRIKNLLHKRFATREMTLEKAQRGIAEDWDAIHIKLLPTH
jgi:hypothetical protein